MKKAILHLLLGAAMGPAAAQSAVTIYGVLDSGLVLEGGGPAGNATKVSGGAAAGSRLGFRGTENLGGGLVAGFVLESGVNVDTGTLNAGGGLFGRQTFVSLSGGFGALSFGRQYSLIYLAVNEVSDPFKTGSAGRANNVLQMAGTRINNAVRYTSPAVGGWHVNLQYAPGEVAGRAAAGRHLDGEVAYAQGPLAGRFIYSTFNDAPLSNTAGLNATRTVTGMGSWQATRALKLHAGYAINRNDMDMNSRDLILGVSFAAAPNRYAASVIRHNDRTAVNADVTQFALGVYHALSPRTELYLIQANMRRENAVAASTFFVGNASDAGTGNRGTNIGIKHNF